MGLLQTITNALSGQKEKNSYSPNHFLKHGGSRGPILTPTWSGVKLDTRDAYRGYPYAAIQKKGNRVAALAKKNLFVDVSPEMLEIYQKTDKDPQHPYLKVINSSTTFSTKKFWKTISIYLDLTGRFYLGAVRQKMPNGQLSNIKEFILLNPLEIRRVINKQGEVAGFVERKADGRQRNWPVHQIITFTEESPFDNDQAWSMVDAAKPAIYTLNQSGDHTRQSINGNLNAPGIITTDIILDDGDFDNFRSRIINGVKGEPIFGNGSGAIQWQDMQVDLNKAALLDVNEINRAEFIAVAGTSKTNLGIEESGTTRETARVQDDNFLRDTIEPRVEDIIDVLNLDYRQNYQSEYLKTQYNIELKSGTSKDYDSEIRATELRTSQAELAQLMFERGYTWESCVSYATGMSSLEDLQLDKKRPAPQEPTVEPNQSVSDKPQGKDSTNTPAKKNEAEKQPINITVEAPKIPEPTVIIKESDEKPTVKVSPIVQVNSKKEDEPEEGPEDQGWVGAIVPAIDVTGRLEQSGLETPFTDVSLLAPETTNIPGEENPHLTLVYGLKDEPAKMKARIEGIIKDANLKSVVVDEISHFQVSTGYAIVAKLVKSPELEKVHEELLGLGAWKQKFPEYTPHITLVYIDETNVDGEFIQPSDFYQPFKDLEGKVLKITSLDFDEPNDGVKNTYKNDISADDLIEVEQAHTIFLEKLRMVHSQVIDTVVNHVTLNSFTEQDIISPEEREGFLNRLADYLKDYWFLLLPIFGRARLQSYSSQDLLFLKAIPSLEPQVAYDISPLFAKEINDNSLKTAESHLSTILNDILKASNNAYNEVLTKAAVELIEQAYERNPDKFADYFTEKPTEKQIRKAIESTDLIEKNRKIYDKANRMALEGYDRKTIINAIREEYTHLSETRATTIARHETSRAYTQAQYDADKKLLNELGQTKNAYKQLFSRSGSPCAYCQALIDRGPVPFEQNFLNKGGSVSVELNGKTHTFTANYEDINSGAIHPNCNCSYRLIIKNGEVANSYEPEHGENLTKVMNTCMPIHEHSESCGCSA